LTLNREDVALVAHDSRDASIAQDDDSVKMTAYRIPDLGSTTGNFWRV
jgi:hypothetical protein